MVESVLPHARLYLSKEPGFEEKADRIALEFRSHELSTKKYSQLVLELIDDPDPAWRITAHLAIETKPSPDYANALMDNLEHEVLEVFQRSETRTLWRWLSAAFSLTKAHPTAVPSILTGRLQEVARRLRARTNIDPGGECRQLIHTILQTLKPAKTAESA